MQAIWKQVAVELAKGLSTGLAVLAGSHCPACEPHLECGIFRCPDCVCGQLERRSSTPRDCPSHDGLAAFCFGIALELSVRPGGAPGC